MMASTPGGTTVTIDQYDLGRPLKLSDGQLALAEGIRAGGVMETVDLVCDSLVKTCKRQGDRALSRHGSTDRDQKIAECAEYYRAVLGDRPGTPESLQQAKRSGIQQIIERAGAKRHNEQLLARIDDAFGEAGIVTFPRLTDANNKPDERIYVCDRDHQRQ